MKAFAEDGHFKVMRTVERQHLAAITVMKEIDEDETDQADTFISAMRLHFILVFIYCMWPCT